MIGLTGPRDGGKYLFHGFDFSVLSFEDMLALKMDFPSGFHPFEYFSEYLSNHLLSLKI